MNYFINDFQSDCVILLSYIEQIEYYAGTERRTGQFKSVKIPKGTGSMLFGYTWKGYLKKDKLTGNNVYREKSKYKGLYKTKCKSMYPELDLIFKEFGQLYFPDFKWSQVQMNLNYKCPPHFDSSNIGESILLTLGDYTGGETIVKIDDNDVIHDSHNNLVKFDGSKYQHWTTDFKGDRYALVFFNNNKLIDQ